MLEAMRVFWTWLGDTDHNGHPNNLIFQDEADSSISMNAIDHSYLWGQGAAADAFPASNGYGSASHALAAEARECTLEAIQSLDKDAVDQLVTRLVGRVVNNDEANGMCAWLANRIGHLPFLLGIGE